MAAGGTGRRWLWFIAYWIAGVAALGLVAMLLRAVIP